MTSESQETAFSSQHCEEEFGTEERLNDHLEEDHGLVPNEDRGDSEDAAAASSDASGSTGSITEENNESPSAAEPAEAAGPTGTDGDVHPETDDDEEG